MIFLQCHEKSGLDLKEFSGRATVSPSGIILEGLHILLNESDINLDFAFNYSGYSDVVDFLDSVKIVADISPSIIRLSDIGFFAPVMFLMDNLVRFYVMSRPIGWWGPVRREAIRRGLLGTDESAKTAVNAATS